MHRGVDDASDLGHQLRALLAILYTPHEDDEHVGPPCVDDGSVMMDGREVQVTLRDSDEGRLMARMTVLLRQYPTTQPTSVEPSHTCPKHGVAMKLNHGKNGSTWYSHKTADGWCTGK